MSIQDLVNCRHLLTEANTPQVDVINQFTFTHYAKAWAHIGFLPVLRKVNPHVYYVKLYFDLDKITDSDELFQFTATYYREKFDELSGHFKCAMIVVAANIWFGKGEITKARSLYELENSLLRTLPDNTPVKSNEEGEGVRKFLNNIPKEFHRWNSMILDGFFEPEYEERCRQQEEEKAEFNPKSKTITLQFFNKTGGPQPVTWDTKTIDKFFAGNVAKEWAMCDGYLPIYRGYENGVIKFKLVTDPRCSGLYWDSLCNSIAVQYKKHVNLLKDATCYKVEHFISNDIIGFYLQAPHENKILEYNERIKASKASLPLNPEMTHYGRIK